MKDNKKGFTLVELLAVIAIIAVLATIATPAVISISNKIKSNMYDAKVKLIIEAAKLYGKDNPSSSSITVRGLVSAGYITKDKNATGTTSIVNPKDNKSMDGCQITLTQDYGRIKATYNKTGGDSC